MINISQHSFVPLSFIKGYYNDSGVYTIDNYGTTSTNFFHVDNCNSCVLYRQIARLSGAIGGSFRFFDGDSLSYKIRTLQVSQYPYSFNFNPVSNMKLTVSYGIPSGLVDFLVYDDPNIQPSLMKFNSFDELDEKIEKSKKESEEIESLFD